MNINADFELRAAEHSNDMPWVPSPMQGVSRRMLDRVGDEVARATSIVRYDAGSQFSAHTHGGGEEFLVLEGVFQDEHGDYPTGTYVRNPVGTRHTPASAPGCVIFVKLWQFDTAEKEILRVDTNTLPLSRCNDDPAVEQSVLFQDARETVTLEQWQPDAQIAVSGPGGVELLVLEGEFTAGDVLFREHAWLRLPRDHPSTIKAGSQGARIWRKSGHLNHVSAPPEA